MIINSFSMSVKVGVINWFGLRLMRRASTGPDQGEKLFYLTKIGLTLTLTLALAQMIYFGLYSRNKPLMVIFHLEDCPHSQGELNY